MNALPKSPLLVRANEAFSLASSTRLIARIDRGYWACFLLLLGSSCAWGQFSIVVDIEKAPFQYSKSPDNNRVSRLRDELAGGQLKLEHTREQGNLRALLAALDISARIAERTFSRVYLI